jgi:hypothetical protein
VGVVLGKVGGGRRSPKQHGTGEGGGGGFGGGGGGAPVVPATGGSD